MSLKLQIQITDVNTVVLLYCDKIFIQKETNCIIIFILQLNLKKRLSIRAYSFISFSSTTRNFLFKIEQFYQNVVKKITSY